MGCYDTVLVPCPKCGEMYPAQSKGGNCTLKTYQLNNAPVEVMGDVNRHAPFTCDDCGTQFEVMVQTMAMPVIHKPESEDDDDDDEW